MPRAKLPMVRGSGCAIKAVEGLPNAARRAAIRFKNRVHCDLFFEKSVPKIDFLSDISSIDLNLKNIGFFLVSGELGRLSVTDESHSCTVFLDTIEDDLAHLGVGLQFL